MQEVQEKLDERAKGEENSAIKSSITLIVLELRIKVANRRMGMKRFKNLKFLTWNLKPAACGFLLARSSKKARL